MMQSGISRATGTPQGTITHTSDCAQRQRLVADARCADHYGRPNIETICECKCHPKLWSHTTLISDDPTK
jgi:hypothetical protein